MPFKDESEVAGLANDLADIKSGVQSFFNGFFTDRVREISAANDVGDDTPEKRAVERRLDAVVTGAGNLNTLIDAMISDSYGALGRLAGIADPSEQDESLDAFNAYLVENGKAFTERVFSRSLSAGTNVGAGKMAILLTDLNGSKIDVGHVDTIAFECNKDSTDGASAGRESFEASGGNTLYPWQEGKAGNGRSYEYDYGVTIEDFSDRETGITTDESFACFGGSSASGNKIRNGDFTSFGSTVPDNWTVRSGDAANITADVTNPISNLNNSASIVADIVIENPFSRGRLINGVAYGLGCKLRTDNGGAGTVTGFVTIQVMARDESEVYATLVVDLSTLTPGNPGEVTIPAPVVFLMPTQAKDAKTKISVTSLAGSAAAPKVTIGDVSVGDTVLVDGIIAAIYSGDHYIAGIPEGRFKRGDSFSVATTGGDAGKLQKYYINQTSQRYMVTSGTGVAPWS